MCSKWLKQLWSLKVNQTCWTNLPDSDDLGPGSPGWSWKVTLLLAFLLFSDELLTALFPLFNLLVPPTELFRQFATVACALFWLLLLLEIVVEINFLFSRSPPPPLLLWEISVVAVVAGGTRWFLFPLCLLWPVELSCAGLMLPPPPVEPMPPPGVVFNEAAKATCLLPWELFPGCLWLWSR